jgi:maleylpyruvate isomerase
MKLYSYYRSSAAYRVRIALCLKNLPYDYEPVHLLRNGGEQLLPAYRALNPDGVVPTFVDDEGHAIQQSLAIIEYLEETHPEPALLPRAALDRAWVRSLALQIACEIHPLNNLRLLKYLKTEFGISDEQKDAWYRHWVASGLATLEQRLAGDARTGAFCYGDTPTLADVFLIPQVFNAQRFHVDVTRYPTIERINAHAMTLEAFIAASPEKQIDAPQGA